MKRPYVWGSLALLLAGAGWQEHLNIVHADYQAVYQERKQLINKMEDNYTDIKLVNSVPSVKDQKVYFPYPTGVLVNGKNMITEVGLSDPNSLAQTFEILRLKIEQGDRSPYLEHAIDMLSHAPGVFQFAVNQLEDEKGIRDKDPKKQDFARQWLAENMCERILDRNSWGDFDFAKKNQSTFIRLINSLNGFNLEILDKNTYLTMIRNLVWSLDSDTINHHGDDILRVLNPIYQGNNDSQQIQSIGEIVISGMALNPSVVQDFIRTNNFNTNQINFSLDGKNNLQATTYLESIRGKIRGQNISPAEKEELVRNLEGILTETGHEAVYRQALEWLSDFNIAPPPSNFQDLKSLMNIQPDKLHLRDLRDIYLQLKTIPLSTNLDARYDNLAGTLIINAQDSNFQHVNLVAHAFAELLKRNNQKAISFAGSTLLSRGNPSSADYFWVGLSTFLSGDSNPMTGNNSFAGGSNEFFTSAPVSLSSTNDDELSRVKPSILNLQSLRAVEERLSKMPPGALDDPKYNNVIRALILSMRVADAFRMDLIEKSFAYFLRDYNPIAITLWKQEYIKVNNSGSLWVHGADEMLLKLEQIPVDRLTRGQRIIHDAMNKIREDYKLWNQANQVQEDLIHSLPPQYSAPNIPNPTAYMMNSFPGYSPDPVEQTFGRINDDIKNHRIENFSQDKIDLLEIISGPRTTDQKLKNQALLFLPSVSGASPAMTPGGIDLKNIKLGRKGQEIQYEFDSAQVHAILVNGVDGFVPEILSITEVASVAPLFVPQQKSSI